MTMHSLVGNSYELINIVLIYDYPNTVKKNDNTVYIIITLDACLVLDVPPRVLDLHSEARQSLLCNVCMSFGHNHILLQVSSTYNINSTVSFV